MVVWAVVSSEIEQAIELFPSRAEAEEMGTAFLRMSRTGGTNCGSRG
jgi:hypothetical protein